MPRTQEEYEEREDDLDTDLYAVCSLFLPLRYAIQSRDIYTQCVYIRIAIPLCVCFPFSPSTIHHTCHAEADAAV